MHRDIAAGDHPDSIVQEATPTTVEAALRETQDRLETVLESIPDAYLALDHELRVRSVNSLALRLAQRRREDVLGKVLWDAFPVYDCDTLHDALGIVMGERRPVRYEIFGTLTHRWFEINIHPTKCGVSIFSRDVHERREAERRLRESEELFSKVFNATPLVVTLTSIDTGELLEVNDAFVRRSGYSRAEALGRSTTELGLWVDLEDRNAVTQAVAERGWARNMEVRFRGRDGREITAIMSAARVEIGTRACMLGVTQDITERKLAEAALRESEERLRLAVEGAGMGTWDTDVTTGTIHWNRQHFAILGYPPDVTNASVDMWWSRVHPEDLPRVQAARQQARDNGQPYIVETRIIRVDDGQVRWLNAFGRFLHDAAGNATRFIGVCFDVTDRKLAEEALKTSERLYRAVGESVDYGVWICDAQGRKTYASESFARLLGMTQEQCCGFGWVSALHPDDTDATVRAWTECVRSGGQWDRELRVRGADGQWHPILSRGAPVRNEAGEIIAWAGINLDIARLKQVEDELREAHSRKDQFLATLAHELRNPLAPLRNGLEIMRLAHGDPGVLETARATMERQLRQLVRLVDDLLDLSRITRGKIELRKERLDLGDVVRDAIETCRPLLDRWGHELTVTLGPEPIFVDADAMRLAQVFGNLLSNAAKYTDRNGRLSLTVERRAGEALVRVKDNGVGIPEHMLTSIFDMFVQVDNRLDAARGGLGIGLSLARQLVEMHGGAIEAHSEGVGAGSEFVVRLPAPAAMERDPTRPESRQFTPARGMRVLVADDNPDSVASLATLLRMAGNDVRVACDGQEALEVADEFRPNVLLLDIGMPKLNGYDVCRRIRQSSWGGDALILALTGWGQMDDVRQSQDAGFDDHLVKPVEPAALQRFIDAQPSRRVPVLEWEKRAPRIRRARPAARGAFPALPIAA